MRGGVGSHVLRQQEEDEAHAVDDDAEVLQERFERLRPQVRDGEVDAELNAAITTIDIRDRHYMINAMNPPAMANRPNEDTATSILRGRGEGRVLGILQQTQNDAENCQNHLRDQTAELLGSHRKDGEEIRHHHHGTDVGTVQRDQRTHVVDPVTHIAGDLEHQLCVRVVRVDLRERLLLVKGKCHRNRRHRVHLVVDIDQLVRGQNHHAAHQHEQEQTRDDTDLVVMSVESIHLVEGERKSERTRSSNTLHQIHTKLGRMEKSVSTSSVFIFPFSSSTNSSGINTLFSSVGVVSAAANKDVVSFVALINYVLQKPNQHLRHNE